MSVDQLVIQRAKNLISVLELKQLLITLKEKRPDICIRYRLLGEMWMKNFMNVVHVTEKGVLLNNQNDMVLISDLSMFMQFELDAPFWGYQPYFHYNVQPYPEV